MSEDELPKRSPGAHLAPHVDPPTGGWFGIEWPSDDPDDEPIATRYLRESEMPSGPEVRAFLNRVLDGLHRLDPDSRS